MDRWLEQAQDMVDARQRRSVGRLSIEILHIRVSSNLPQKSERVAIYELRAVPLFGLSANGSGTRLEKSVPVQSDLSPTGPKKACTLTCFSTGGLNLLVVGPIPRGLYVTVDQWRRTSDRGPRLEIIAGFGPFSNNIAETILSKMHAICVIEKFECCSLRLH